ncbi:MAG: prolyl aminopeptidase, partial [Deinococcota bacterium]
REVRWITHDMGRLFPREWERFTALLAEDERYGNIAAGYVRLLADPNPDVRERAAYEWCLWEDTHVSLMPSWQPNPRYQDPEFRMVFARLVTHYWRHTCFLQDGEIMANILSINHIPAVLIHGRYDISGPLDIAWELHKAWSRSDLVVLEDAGHGGLGFPEAMTTALNKLSHIH